MTDQPITEIDAHKGHAVGIAFSPDGRSLLTGGFDGLVKVWSVGDWQQTGVFEGHEKSVNAIVFANDGRTLVTSSTDRTVHLWQYPSGEPTTTLTGHRNTVMGLAVSPDGQTIASASYDGSVRLWPLSGDGGPAILKAGSKNVTSVAFTPDGQFLASAGLGDEVVIWSTVSHEVVTRLGGVHRDAVASIQAPPDGEHLVSLGAEGTMAVWSTGDWSLERKADLSEDAPRSLTLSPSGSRIAITFDYGVTVLSWSDFAPLARFPVRVKGMHFAAFSPDEALLAVSTADGRVRVWDISGS